MYLHCVIFRYTLKDRFHSYQTVFTLMERNETLSQNSTMELNLALLWHVIAQDGSTEPPERENSTGTIVHKRWETRGKQELALEINRI